MTKFLHTCVRVKDLEASLKFYKKLLVSKKLVAMIFQNINSPLSTCNSKMILITSWN